MQLAMKQQQKNGIKERHDTESCGVKNEMLNQNLYDILYR